MEKNKFFNVFMIFVLLGSLVGPVNAQESTGTVTGKAEPVVTAEEPKDVVEKKSGPGFDTGADDTTASGNVSMDFKSADINNVLRILSYKGNVNIVAGPEVTGEITIRLTDVPWEKAMDIVLRTYGFAYEREGNVIRVTTIESLKQEELTTEVYSLNFAKAEEVAESIKNMLTDRGKVKIDERTNVVVATDIPTNLYKLGLIIKKLDKRTPQVLIEAKIIETSLDDSERLGIDWTTTITASGASKPMTFPFSRRVDTTLEEGFDQFFASGAAAAPVAGAQFAGTTESEFPDLGPEQLTAFPFAETTDFSFGTLDFTQFRAVLEFLEERTDTDVLSNPRITTLNNKESSILVGSQMLFPSFNFNEETGDFVISGFDDVKDLGVKLLVTPHVNAQGDIVVKLKPEIKAFTGIQTLDATRGIVAPIFSTREASAEVMIRDGDTIMLGGLISKTTSMEENKIPLLGDIPLIGDYFFTKKEENIERTELIIFITVHLLKDNWDSHLDPTMKKYKMPVPRDKETLGVMPQVKQKKKKKWWQF